jgi:hypothetical protein
MEENNKLSWAVPAYSHDKKTVDWFWGFGIIILASFITSILLGNYYFAVVLLLGGIMMVFFAHQEPETLYYELNKKGLKIKDKLYPYKTIKAFWIRKNENPCLFIKTERFFLPEIKLRINHNVSEKIREIFIAENIPEQEMKEHLSETIMDIIGY